MLGSGEVFFKGIPNDGSLSNGGNGFGSSSFAVQVVVPHAGSYQVSLKDRPGSEEFSNAEDSLCKHSKVTRRSATNSFFLCTSDPAPHAPIWNTPWQTEHCTTYHCCGNSHPFDLVAGANTLWVTVREICSLASHITVTGVVASAPPPPPMPRVQPNPSDPYVQTPSPTCAEVPVEPERRRVCACSGLASVAAPGTCRRFTGDVDDDAHCVAGRSPLQRMTYAQVFEKCHNLGLEMCNTACVNQGCNYNAYPVWTNLECTLPPPSPPPPELPPPQSPPPPPEVPVLCRACTVAEHGDACRPATIADSPQAGWAQWPPPNMDEWCEASCRHDYVPPPDAAVEPPRAYAVHDKVRIDGDFACVIEAYADGTHYAVDYKDGLTTFEVLLGSAMVLEEANSVWCTGSSVCGATPMPTCGGPYEPCYYDTSCSDPASPIHARGLGCNAAGVRNCRFCGFSHYPACPDQNTDGATATTGSGGPGYTHNSGTGNECESGEPINDVATCMAAAASLGWAYRKDLAPDAMVALDYAPGGCMLYDGDHDNGNYRGVYLNTHAGSLSRRRLGPQPYH